MAGPNINSKNQKLENIKLVVNYLLFSLIAAFSNIASQIVCMKIYDGEYSTIISIFMGLLIGLVVKFYLDKFFIFKFQEKNSNENMKKFLLYSLLGVFTTGVFLAFEFLFIFLFEGLFWRYFGAMLGLFIGYYLKYKLDKRFVFL